MTDTTPFVDRNDFSKLIKLEYPHEVLQNSEKNHPADMNEGNVDVKIPVADNSQTKKPIIIDESKFVSSVVSYDSTAEFTKQVSDVGGEVSSKVRDGLKNGGVKCYQCDVFEKCFTKPFLKV